MNQEEQKIISRPPVVVILGHVDHGKSSILEAIKDLKITKKESGGITQHIGAYEVEHQNKKITFLDTPGHEAFSSMRSRGSSIADIAVLVVAADDGVKGQTKEAIGHIKEAEIPVIVAINKIDKPEADPDRVVQQLAEAEIYLESIGGKVPGIFISAKTGKNIGDLLEMLLLVAEMEKLETDITIPATGIIIESHLDSLRGPVTTVITKTGILKKGDIIATTSTAGKVKSLEDFQKNKIESARPSTPAIIYGFENMPLVGSQFKVFSSNEEARQFGEINQLSKKDIQTKNETAEKVINLILKTDFFGSLEAIEGMIAIIPQERIALKIIKSGVGDINESDLKLAKSAEAIIFGFKVKVISQVESMIERERVNLFIFDIIYKLVDKIKEIMETAIVPRIERIELGKCKVLALFFHEKNHQIIGCKVIQGEIKREAELEVVRIISKDEGETKVGSGKIKKLKIGNREVDKVGQGEECGISYEGNIKIEEGDLLQVYVMKKEEIIKTAW